MNGVIWMGEDIYPLSTMVQDSHFQRINFRILKVLVATLKRQKLFYCFDCERNYDVLKSKSPDFLLSKNVSFDKNELKSEMKNPTYPFRDANLLLQLV